MVDESNEEAAGSPGPVLLVLAAVLAIGGPAAIYLGTHAFLNSATFLVREVSVVGNVEHSEEELLAVTGLDRPRNVLTCRTGEMERALRGLDWVREVRVERLRGNRLSIEVREATWQSTLAVGEPWLVGEDGLPIRRWRSEDGSSRPFVLGRTGMSEAVIEDGAPPTYSVEAVLRAHSLLEVWSDRFDGEGMAVMEVEILSAGRYRLALDGGMEIHLSEDDLAARLDRLALVLEQRPGAPARVERVLLDGVNMNRIAVRISESTDGQGR